jgi:hypothetical protein
MPPVGFKPTVSAGEWPQTYALDCAAIGTGCHLRWHVLKSKTVVESAADGQVAVFVTLSVLLCIQLSEAQW